MTIRSKLMTGTAALGLSTAAIGLTFAVALPGWSCPAIGDTVAAQPATPACDSSARTSAASLAVIGASAAALIVHGARLQAELDNRASIELPTQIATLQDNDVVKRSLVDEQIAMQGRKAAFAFQIDTLARSKAFTEQQLQFTQLKLDSLTKYVAQLQRQITSVAGLVDRGIGALSHKLVLENNIVQHESNLLDLRLVTLRARDELQGIDQNVELLKSQRTNDLLLEINDNRGKLNVLLQQGKAVSEAAANSQSTGACQ